MKPEDLLESVTSRESFLSFLLALHEECLASQHAEQSQPSSPYGPAAFDWENVRLDDFLEAMHAWATDSEALPADPSWHAFAQLLLAGKGYE